MALDELFKGMQMFQNGVQQLGVNAGIQQAQSQLDQINQSQADEMQKRQMKEQAARQLSLQMVGLGANQSQIQTAQQAMMPEAINSGADMVRQGVMTGDMSMQKAGKNLMSVEETPTLDKQALVNKGEANKANITGGYEIEKANIMADGKQKSDFNKIVQKPFDTETKPLIESLNSLDTAEMQSALKNPVSDTAVRSAVARSVGSEKGKIPVQELALYSGSPDAGNVFKRAYGKLMDGQVITQKDRDLIMQTMSTAKASKERQLSDAIKKHAGRANENDLVDSPEDAVKKLAGGDPRLRRLGGLDQAPADAPVGHPDAPPGLPPALSAGGQVVWKKNNITGVPQKLFQGSDGKLYPLPN